MAGIAARARRTATKILHRVNLKNGKKAGVTVREVAELLGNTEDMVRARYSAWVEERQTCLTKILREAFANKPKLVAIDGGRR